MDATPDTYWDLFFGYSAFWVIFALFVCLLMRRQIELDRRLEQLSRRLEAAEQK